MHIAPFPYRIIFEVTNRCDLDCIMCGHSKHIYNNFFQDTNDKVVMSLQDMWSGVREVLLYGYGEPLLNTSLDYIIQTIKMSSKARCKINTNGVLATTELLTKLVKSGLDEIVFSIDSLDPAKFEHIRKGAIFNVVMKHLYETLEIRKNYRNIKIGIQFTAMRSNISELEKMIRFCNINKIDSLIVDFIKVKNEGLIDESLFFHQDKWDSIITAAKRQNISFPIIAPPLFSEIGQNTQASTITCREPFESIFVGCTGEVYICCFCGHRCRLGNVVDEPWQNLWQGDVLENFRQNFHTNSNTICNRCMHYRKCNILKEKAHVIVDLQQKPIAHLCK